MRKPAPRLDSKPARRVSKLPGLCHCRIFHLLFLCHKTLRLLATGALLLEGALLVVVAAAAAVAVALVLLAQVFAPHFLGVEVAATYLRGAVLGGRRRGLDSPLTLYTPSHHEKPRSQ